jgi:OOP family OmpA-OmpF porin
VADREKGKKTLKEICEVNNCAYIEGVDLLSDAEILDRFVAEVFYLEVPEEKLEKLFVPPEVGPETSLEDLVQDDVLFDFDKYDLIPEWSAFLDEIADALLKQPDVHIVIEGHTDWIGTEAYNQKLSERRAKAVYDYLLGKGIESARMETIGYGETLPAVSNLADEGRMLNRRAVINVVH